MDSAYVGVNGRCVVQLNRLRMLSSVLQGSFIELSIFAISGVNSVCTPFQQNNKYL